MSKMLFEIFTLFQHVINIKIIVIFYILFLVLSLGDSRVLHLQRISIWTNHISSVQQRHG